MTKKEKSIEMIKVAFDVWEEEYGRGDDWSEEHEARDMAIKAIEQEPCEDAVSRSQALEELEESAKHHANDSREEVLLRRDREIIRALPPVTPKGVTVTDFADRCRECGARYGKYKDFCEFVAKIVLRDDFEENAGANAEILCRKLSELGFIKADKDEWVSVEMDGEDERR